MTDVIANLSKLGLELPESDELHEDSTTVSNATEIASRPG